MSVFILETDAVTSAADGLNSITSSLENLSNSVSSYDTSQSGGDSFDFDGAKSVIAENIKAASIKVQNTQTIMNNVVDSHTKLQSALIAKDSDSKSSNSNNSGSRSSNSNGYSSSYSNGGYSSGGYNSGGYNSGGYSSGVVAAAAASQLKKKTEENVDITGSFKEVGYVYVEKEKLSDESKKIFENSDFKYDENGYAKIGDKYVVSVDKSLGNVGDIIKFKQKDGTEIEAIIGVTTSNEKYKDKINFILSPDKKLDAETQKISEDILKNNKEIEKTGNIIEPEKTEEINNTTANTTATATPGITTKVTGQNVLNGNVIDTSKPVGTGTKYSNLSNDDLARLAYVAEREQGSVEGAKLELSLMANLYEKNKDHYSSVLDYVDNSGWFADGSTSGYSYPGDEYVAAAREVLQNGNRYLASNVVEHDYLGDLVYCSTGDVYDKDSYIPGETILENQWGARYVFVGFAPNGGDPFGYLIN